MNTTLLAYRIQATLTHDGTLTLDNLPFQAGESVEIIVRTHAAALEAGADPSTRYPLRGLVIPYDRPTEPVALEDWDALQ